MIIVIRKVVKLLTKLIIKVITPMLIKVIPKIVKKVESEGIFCGENIKKFFLRCNQR